MTENDRRNGCAKIRLFDDKPRFYAGPSPQAETTYTFLDRSSLPEFGRVRCMLERWVERLPKEPRKNAVGSMRHRAPGSKKDEYQFIESFFELFMHEFLLGTGGEVLVDPKIDGRTPDFRVIEELSGGSEIAYVVEATVNDLERSTELEKDWNESLIIDWLNEIYSPNYYLDIDMEGKLESTPRKKDLKRPFENLLKEADSEKDYLISQGQKFDREDLPKTSFDHGDWLVVGRLVPVLPEYRGKTGPFVANSPIKSDHIDDIGKTKDRLYKKAGIYSRVDNLIIALRCDHWNHRLGEVLFGSQQFTTYFHNDSTKTDPLPEPYYSQKRDGIWINSAGPQNLNVMGVAAFYDVCSYSLDKTKAVFYSNPYVDKPLPDWTKSITHAEYSDGKINIVEGVAPCKFLKDYVRVGNPFG